MLLFSMLKHRDIHTYRDSSARSAGLEVFEELVLRGESLAANAARVRLLIHCQMINSRAIFVRDPVFRGFFFSVNLGLFFSMLASSRC